MECKVRVGRKSANRVSHSETKSNVANNLAMPRFLKGVYTKHWRIKWRCRAVLSQRQIGKDLPTAFARRSFKKTEKNYSTAEKSWQQLCGELNTSGHICMVGNSK